MSEDISTRVIRTQHNRSRMNTNRNLLLTIQIGTPILLLLAWWFGSLNSTNPYFPPLKIILIKFQELWLFENFFSDIVPSVGNFLLGYFIAIFFGVLLGIALGLIKPLFWLLDPIVQLVRSIPAVALLPIFIALLGFGNEVRVFAVALAAMFPVLISTIDGVRATEPLLLETAKSYRLSKGERLTQIYLFAAAPQIFAGALVSLQVAFIVMITSEMMGAARGIGALTLLAQKSFEVDSMWAGIILLGILGFLANLCFVAVRKWVLKWFIGAQKAASAD